MAPEVLLLLLLIPLSVLNCAYALSPPRVVEGRAFPLAEARAIEEGALSSEVLELLGEPLLDAPKDDGREWIYRARELGRGRDIYVLGLIPWRGGRSLWEHELRLRVRDGVVEAVAYTETRIR